MLAQVYSRGDPASRVWAPATMNAVNPLITSSGRYFNYFECAEDPWEMFYGPHAARLQQIKQFYDPDDHFQGLSCQCNVVHDGVTTSS